MVEEQMEDIYNIVCLHSLLRKMESLLIHCIAFYISSCIFHPCREISQYKPLFLLFYMIYRARVSSKRK